MDDYPEGETVTAYYDPDNPSNSFLIKDQQLLFLGMAGFGGLFALFGVAALGRKILGFAT